MRKKDTMSATTLKCFRKKYIYNHFIMFALEKENIKW